MNIKKELDIDKQIKELKKQIKEDKKQLRNKFFEIVLKKVKTKVLIRVFLFTMFLFIVLFFTNCQSQDNIIYNVQDNKTDIIIDDNKSVSCCFKECFVSQLTYS